MKWLFIPALLAIAIACVYWFIPAKLEVEKIIHIKTPVAAAYRGMLAEEKRAQWLGKEVRFDKKLLNAFEVRIQDIAGTINLLPSSSDSAIIQWKCTVNTGNSPVTRWRQYRHAKAIRDSMTASLERFAEFVQKKENIYDIVIGETPLTDTVLVATKTTLPCRPNTKEIYKLVQALRNYSASFNAKVTGPPMLNVTQQDRALYEVMVALPLDQRIPDKGAFFYRRMIPRKFLFTQVQGGDHAVLAATSQLNHFIKDYRRTVMALPFERLVTDRSTEPDTSQWRTQIYVPIY